MTTIIVRAKSQVGRYRAGMHFTRDATVLAVADLTKEQLQALRADPELTVTLPAETDAERAKREAALKAAEEQAAADAKAKAAADAAKASGTKKAGK